MQKPRIARAATAIAVIALAASPLGATVEAATDAPPTATCRGHEATIVGTDAADVLQGTPGRDVIVAGAGNDIIDAGRGDDVICAGQGRDTVNGGRGDDILHGGANADELIAGRGTDRSVDRHNDRVWDGEGWSGSPNVFVDGPGADTMRGRDRNHARDTLSFAESPKPVELTWDKRIARAGKTTNHFAGMGQVIGSPHDDRLTGRNKPGITDTIYAGDGNDVVRGLAGDDLISAGEPPPPTTHNKHEPPGPGWDTLIGGRGNDTLLPGGRRIGPGDARVRAQGGLGDDFIGIGTYGGRADGGAGNDTLRIHTHHRIHVELTVGKVDGMPLRLADLERHRFDVWADGNTVIGTARDDDVDAESGSFRLQGAGGDDVLKSEGTIIGGQGSDRITCVGECDARGGKGPDRIDSLGWKDPTRPRSAHGGPGADRISWSAGPALGGQGHDIVGSYGDPVVASPVEGGQGNDVVRALGAATLADIPHLSGGVGIDTIDLAEYFPDTATEPRGVAIDLAAGTSGDSAAVRTPLIGIENATGSRYDDTLVGDDADNSLAGGDGTDAADGRGGDDTCEAESVANCEN